MTDRPNFIKMPSGNSTPAFPSPSGSQGMPSPRIPRVAGDLAPAMSPLDMFAAQSRALAKQLEDERRNDRRVSRLPPLAVTEGLSKRPNYHQGPHSSGGSGSGSPRARSLPRGGGNDSPQRDDYIPSPEDSGGNRLEIENPAFRPQSFHPRLSRITATPDLEGPPHPEVIEEENFSTPMEDSGTGGDYFGQRTRSPEPTERPSLDSSSYASSHASSQPSYGRPKQGFESSHHQYHQQQQYNHVPLHRGMSTESTSSRVSQYSSSLQPPNPMFARKAPSIRSVSSEDDNPGITPSSSVSQTRKLSSGSSGVSLPLSPQSSFHHDRSISQMSDFRLSKPSFNFSRPMSRGSRPSVDSPSRMSSMDSHTRGYAEDEVQTPMSTDSGMGGGAMLPPSSAGEQAIEVERQSLKDEEEGVLQNSYIYAKFSLPRGRVVQRDSLPFEAMMPKFSWEQQQPPASESNVRPIRPGDLSSIPAGLPTPPHSIESDRSSNDPQLPRTSTESLPARPPPIPAAARDNHRHSMTSMNTHDSGSTIKASQARQRAAEEDELSAEDHLNKGIACHESGSLNESTYHFRLAARMNNPTGMLMYALACRHGWGMRANAKEGVTWLRKAMDCASIEMSVLDEGDVNGSLANPAPGTPMKAPPPGHDPAAMRTRQAQFALSVYELGVSHLNGWGIEADKFLALRCFEIAASWGDADAMAEAGFCWANGVGCKKDLKKAAGYYRKAADKGVSMVGNSWIYKSKYDPDPEKDNKDKDRDRDERKGRSTRVDSDKDKKEKKRDKSRTRSIFGRKKAPLPTTAATSRDELE